MLALAGPPSAATAASATATASPPAWQSVAVPSSVTAPAGLNDVSATGSADAWAVGADAETAYNQGTPVMLHWDGTAWSSVMLPPLPAPGTLNAVSADSRADAWAVGSDAAGSVALHWNGHAWRKVAFPGQATDTVDWVAAEPDGTAWMVGSHAVSGLNQTLVERWNGRAWRVVATGLGQGELTKAEVSASGDVWAVGYNSGGSPIVVHENAGAWSTLPVLPISQANDVLAVSDDDVWAVGLAFNSAGGVYSAQICQWDGSTWACVNEPANAISQDWSISPGSTGQPQWAGAEAGLDPSATLYAYYDGTAWSSVTGATTLSGVSDASEVTGHIPGTNATWAVGKSADLTAQGLAPVSAFVEYNPGG
jgi:hypothetical protein